MTGDHVSEQNDGLERVVRTALVDEHPDHLRAGLHALTPIRLDDVEIAHWMPAPPALQREGDEGAALCDWRSAGHIIVRFEPSRAGTALAIRAEGFASVEPPVRVQVARAEAPFLDLDDDGRAFVPAHHVFRVVVNGPGVYVSDWIA